MVEKIVNVRRDRIHHRPATQSLGPFQRVIALAADALKKLSWRKPAGNVLIEMHVGPAVLQISMPANHRDLSNPRAQDGGRHNLRLYGRKGVPAKQYNVKTASQSIHHVIQIQSLSPALRTRIR
jgi:hypothetical protein